MCGLLCVPAGLTTAPPNGQTNNLHFLGFGRLIIIWDPNYSSLSSFIYIQNPNDSNKALNSVFSFESPPDPFVCASFIYLLPRYLRHASWLWALCWAQGFAHIHHRWRSREMNFCPNHRRREAPSLQARSLLRWSSLRGWPPGPSLDCAGQHGGSLPCNNNLHCLPKAWGVQGTLEIGLKTTSLIETESPLCGPSSFSPQRMRVRGDSSSCLPGAASGGNTACLPAATRLWPLHRPKWVWELYLGVK